VKTKGTAGKARPDDEYGECGCFGDADDAAATRTATTGYCDKGCDMALKLFLVGLFLMLFSTFMNNVPASVVVLRSLSADDQSLGLALHSFVYRLLGAVPGK
jgi:hypothetical protein